MPAPPARPQEEQTQAWFRSLLDGLNADEDYQQVGRRTPGGGLPLLEGELSRPGGKLSHPEGKLSHPEGKLPHPTG